jgi:hypothetical protein
MDEERGREEDSVSPEDEGIPDHGGPARGKQETGDPQEGLLPPGDEPRAAEDFGTTAEEQLEGESLDDKLAEEVPERSPDTRSELGRLVEPGSGLADEEKDEVAEEAEDDRTGESAEEAAMRDEEEPGGLTGGPDRYVESDKQREEER